MVYVGCNKTQTSSETCFWKRHATCKRVCKFWKKNANQDISVLEDLCSKDLSEPIPEDFADEVITDAKALIFNEHIRKSFNGLDYETRISHSIGPLVLKVKRGSIVTCSTNRECLNNLLYSACNHSLAIAQHIIKFKDIINHVCKNAETINLSSLAGFGRLSRSGTKKGFAR